MASTVPRRRRLEMLLESRPTAASASSPQIAFHYFHGRGIGETVRLMCVVGGLEFEDKRYTMEEFRGAAATRAATPFGQFPALCVDGVWLGQTITLARTCARLGGLYPSGAVAQGVSDMIVDQTQDIHSSLTKLQYDGTPGAVGTKRTPPAELKAKMATFFADKLPGMLDKLEKLLPAGPSTR